MRMTWLLTWLNVSVATLNVTFQLLVLYIYIYIYAKPLNMFSLVVMCVLW